MRMFINLNYNAPKIITKSSSNAFTPFGVCFRRFEIGDLRCGHSSWGQLKCRFKLLWCGNAIGLNGWTQSTRNGYVSVGRSIMENGNGRAVV